MTAKIPDSHVKLLDKPVHAKVATVMPDGRPQVHPVWCDYDGTYVRINSAKGRQKDLNLREREYATILLIDEKEPYYWVEIRGHLAETVEGPEADQHIDSLAYKYTGQDKYPNRTPGEVRVMYKIEPDRVLASGSSNGE
jgi:PPOX class probable F420-dependent enzyme